MKTLSDWISGYTQYTFLGRVPKSRRLVVLEEISRVSGTQENRRDVTIEELEAQTRRRLIININRALLFVLLGSFISLTILPLLIESDKIPGVLEQAFWLLLGYFGNTVLVYFENTAPGRRKGASQTSKLATRGEDDKGS